MKISDTCKGGLLEYVVVNYRWVLVLFVVIPLSVVYDSYAYVRNKIVFFLKSAPKMHDSKVKSVQKQVREWKASGSQKHMCTARPGWQSMSIRNSVYKKSLHNVHVDLVDILEVNIEKGFIRAEPMVTMGQVTATLCPLGFTLAIVPELEDLTVGGMINGSALETASHIYGLFQHIALAYELVMPDGSVVRCTKDDHPDLFYAVPWSHGTVGFLVSAELKIVPCKPYVKLEYIPLLSKEDVCRKLTEESKKEKPVDFVEAIMFTDETGVVLLGQMTDQPESNKVNRIGSFYKPFFYKHVEKFLHQKQRAVEYIPLRDYYHRHSRSIFWEMLDIIPFGNLAVFRYLLGWTLPMKISFLKLTQGETLRQLYKNHHFLQDIMIPLNKLSQFLEFADETVKIYPVWLCPFRLFDNPGMIHPQPEDNMYVDVGLYGTPHQKAFEIIPKVESYAIRQHGYMMLYSYSYMSKNEFRQMFDMALYDRVRGSMGCKEAFPDVYDKTCKCD